MAARRPGETSGFARADAGQTEGMDPQSPEAVLADVASAVQAEADDEVLAEAIGIRHAEQSRVTLADRWRAARGCQVLALVPDGAWVGGIVGDAGPEVVLLDVVGRPVLLGLPVPVSGLPWVLAAEEPGAGDGPGRVGAGPTWGRILREGLESGDRYRIVTPGAELEGMIEGVGRDHVDLAGDRIWSIPFACILRCEQR